MESPERGSLPTPPAAPLTTRGDLRSALIEGGIVLGLGLLVALATTWPLALHLGSIAQNSTDAPFQAWTIDHVQWAVTGHGSLWDANIFAPNRHTLAYSDSLLGIAVPMLPLRWLGADPIAQVNIALLFALTTSAAGGYLFGRVISGERSTGAITAAAFSYGPYGAISAYQLHAAMHVGVALAATGAWWLANRAENGRPLWLPWALLVTSTIWQMSVSFYPGAYAFAAILMVGVVRRRDLARRGLLALVGGLSTIVVATVVLALPYIAVVREGRHFVGSANEVAKLGVDFTRVERATLVWGRVVGTGIFPAPAFPGVSLLLFTAVGAVSFWRFKGRGRRIASVATVFLIAGAFLGLGTSGHGWRAYSPYRLLFEFVPGFDILRASNRAWILGLLGLGLFAGEGISAVARRVKPRMRSVALVAISLAAVIGVIVEGYESWNNRPSITVSAVDRELARQPAPGGVIYLPTVLSGPPALLTTFGQIENVYGTTAHHRITPNGYSGLIPREWPAFSRRMLALPSAGTLQRLRSIGVHFVVVRSWAKATPWERFLRPAQAAPLRYIGTFDGDVLYVLPGRA